MFTASMGILICFILARRSSCLNRTHDLDESMGGEKWKIVVKKGNQFVVSGQPFYVNGFNTYWLMLLASPMCFNKHPPLALRSAGLGLSTMLDGEPCRKPLQSIMRTSSRWCACFARRCRMGWWEGTQLRTCTYMKLRNHSQYLHFSKPCTRSRMFHLLDFHA